MAASNMQQPNYGRRYAPQRQDEHEYQYQYQHSEHQYDDDILHLTTTTYEATQGTQTTLPNTYQQQWQQQQQPQLTFTFWSPEAETALLNSPFANADYDPTLEALGYDRLPPSAASPSPSSLSSTTPPVSHYSESSLSTLQTTSENTNLPPQPGRHICRFLHCPSTFTRTSDLERHILTIHIPSNIYFCPVPGCRTRGSRSQRPRFKRRDKWVEHLRRWHKELNV